MLMVYGKWPTPAVGSTVYYRVYHRSAFPNNLADGGYHPLQNGLNNLAWEWKTGVVENGHVVLEWWFNPFVGNYPWTHFDTGSLFNNKTPVYSVNKTWRIEWALTRNTISTAKVLIRIYDESQSTTTPVFTNDNFWDMDGVGSLTADVAHGTVNLVPSLDESFQNINLGNNGPDVYTRTGNNYEYYGGFAVCLTDWCGPYVSTRG
jgi:hypothetical protein